MKKSKIIVPALGILVLSTAAAVTGTVAWFTSSNLVSISGMQVKIEAEDGIVMSNEARGTWETSVSASHSGANQQFMVTSTSDLSKWYHANSANADSHVKDGDYTKLDVTKPTINTGDGLGKTSYNNVDKNIYLLNGFYLQSASGVELEDQDVILQNLNATAEGGSALLNKALRVAVAYQGELKAIYAPFAESAVTYNVHGDTQTTAIVKSTTTTLATGETLPSFTTGGSEAKLIEVYAFFEGEDENCKSANITATLDAISISFEIINQ